MNKLLLSLGLIALSPSLFGAAGPEIESPVTESVTVLQLDNVILETVLKLNETLTELTQRIERLESRPQASTSTSSSGCSRANTLNDENFDLLTRRIKDVNNKVLKLEERFNNFQKNSR